MNKKFYPNDTIIGILGGGQLARMMIESASRLGYHCHIYDPSPDAPASHITNRATHAPFDDENALMAFAKQCDIVTLEFENIPVSALELIAQYSVLAPKASILDIAQQRHKEKEFFNSLGIETAQYYYVEKYDDIAQIPDFTHKAICKTTRLGYDGHGQVPINNSGEIAAAFEQLHQQPMVVELFVDFIGEISTIIARNHDGEMRVFPIGQNIHEGGILRESIVPAAFDDTLLQQAIKYAEQTAQALDVVGLLAIEWFVTKDHRLIANEMAPRPHNSGHWTQDGCSCDQFEQHIRAICNLPLATLDFVPTNMINLLGTTHKELQDYLWRDDIKLHWYGKTQSRPLRKMGHYNIVK